MEAVDNAIMEPIEECMDKLGLMQGDMAPLKRTLVGLGIGGAVCYAFHPKFAYNSDNTPRPWAITADKNAHNTTYFPWWLVCAVPAVILGVLI